MIDGSHIISILLYLLHIMVLNFVFMHFCFRVEQLLHQGLNINKPNYGQKHLICHIRCTISHLFISVESKVWVSSVFGLSPSKIVEGFTTICKLNSYWERSGEKLGIIFFLPALFRNPETRICIFISIDMESIYHSFIYKIAQKNFVTELTKIDNY